MNYVNEHLQGTKLDAAFVQEVNRRVGRLSTLNSGKFRRSPAKWNLHDLDDTEAIFWYYIDRTDHTLEFFRDLGWWEGHSMKFCESIEGIFNNQDRYLRVTEQRYFSTQSVKHFLQILGDPRILIKQETGLPCKIDINAAEKWESEEREDNPEYKAGFIDCEYWCHSRIYKFSMPEEVEERLAESVRMNTRSSLHPIEQAAHLWLDLIRIHPFNDAHKRTGKAIATFILLKNGYLPPLLTNHDVEICLKMLIANVDPRRAYHYFTQYFAGLVKRTQDQYAGQTV